MQKVSKARKAELTAMVNAMYNERAAVWKTLLKAYNKMSRNVARGKAAGQVELPTELANIQAATHKHNELFRQLKQVASADRRDVACVGSALTFA